MVSCHHDGNKVPAVRRTQVQLDEATYDAVRRKSFEERRSIAAVIRELVARSVGTAPARSKLRRLAEFSFIGAGRSKQGRLSPISEKHDEALAQAFRKAPRR